MWSEYVKMSYVYDDIIENEWKRKTKMKLRQWMEKIVKKVKTGEDESEPIKLSNEVLDMLEDASVGF